MLAAAAAAADGSGSGGAQGAARAGARSRPSSTSSSRQAQRRKCQEQQKQRRRRAAARRELIAAAHHTRTADCLLQRRSPPSSPSSLGRGRRSSVSLSRAPTYRVPTHPTFASSSPASLSALPRCAAPRYFVQATRARRNTSRTLRSEFSSLSSPRMHTGHCYAGPGSRCGYGESESCTETGTRRTRVVASRWRRSCFAPTRFSLSPPRSPMGIDPVFLEAARGSVRPCGKGAGASPAQRRGDGGADTAGPSGGRCLATCVHAARV